MKVSDTIIYIMKIMWRDLKKFIQVVSKKYKKAMKVQILNEVALRQVVRKRVSFQDRKNENTPKLPSIEIWHLSSILTLLEINLSHLQHLLNNLSRPLKIIFVFFLIQTYRIFYFLRRLFAEQVGSFSET